MQGHQKFAINGRSRAHKLFGEILKILKNFADFGENRGATYGDLLENGRDILKICFFL